MGGTGSGQTSPVVGKGTARAPGLTHAIPIPYGSFREFLDDPLEFQLRVRERFGDVFRYRIGPLIVHFVYHPDHVHRVLTEHQPNYLRGWQYKILQRLFGDNLVVSEGNHWRRQRKLAQPAFHHQRLSGYGKIMVDATSGMIRGWNEAARRTQPIDTGTEMSRLALAIASRTLFGRDVSGEADVVGETFGSISRHLENRFNRPFTTPPPWLPTPGSVRFRRAAKTLNAIVLSIIHERRSDGSDHGDLLSMLMHARDEETGETMTDEELRGEVLAFLLAGHDTTATALTWTLYLLASHPSIQHQVHDEVDRNLGSREPEVSDILGLKVTQMVIEESMRLYPPIWAIARQAVKEDELGGYRIPVRSTVVLSPFVTQRHGDFWENPEMFDPGRFEEKRKAERPKGAYFPFLAGPHRCIGKEFAMLEMRLVLAMVLQKFEVERCVSSSIRPKASLVLRPGTSVELVLRPRKSGQ